MVFKAGPILLVIFACTALFGYVWFGTVLGERRFVDNELNVPILQIEDSASITADEGAAQKDAEIKVDAATPIPKRGDEYFPLPEYDIEITGEPKTEKEDSTTPEVIEPLPAPGYQPVRLPIQDDYYTGDGPGSYPNGPFPDYYGGGP